MEYIEIIGLIGSIVSIISAFIAFWGVRKVRQAKNEIFLKLRIMKNSEFLSLNRSILSQLKQLTTAKKIPIGTNFDRIIEELFNYYESLSRLRQNVKLKDKIIDNHLQKLRGNINVAKTLDRKDSQKVVDVYTEIYYYLIEIEKDVLKMNNDEIEK